jgi:hypothetical protein
VGGGVRADTETSNVQRSTSNAQFQNSQRRFGKRSSQNCAGALVRIETLDVGRWTLDVLPREG